MGTARERILDAAEDLIAAGHVPPSLDAVAAAAGVSKGGLLYHFDKQSLLHGLVARAVRRADDELTAAAAAGVMAATWLRLSVPGHDERHLYRAMLSLLRLTSRGELDLPPDVDAAAERWRRLLTAELGDPGRARLVHLVGDGLFLAALTGQPATHRDVDDLIDHLGLPTPQNAEPR